MTELPLIVHEQIDDIPVIIGLSKQLGLGRVLNEHLGTHGKYLPLWRIEPKFSSRALLI